MRLPRLFRTTTFRLTLLFLALFAAAASAFLTYIYVATAGEVTRRAENQIRSEMVSLQAVWRRGGVTALNQAIIERGSPDSAFVYLLLDAAGQKISGTIAESPIPLPRSGEVWTSFRVTHTDPDGDDIRRPARGLMVHLESGGAIFVGLDVGEGASYVRKIVRALWGAGALVILLGLIGGVTVSRNLSTNVSRLVAVVSAVRAGDLHARADVRGTNDEYDELAIGLNDMLDRLERSMGGLRHAGDSIAHDLRSPLTRLRARLEVALIDVEAGKGDPRQALETAVEDTDAVLRTFGAVLAIARLQSAGEAPDQLDFDPGTLALSVAELYQPLCEEKALSFEAEVIPGLRLRGNREFIAQAIANILDNAVKYTPSGGAVMLRSRRRASGEVEFSVTDTGPGIPFEDRTRVTERFVRLEHSRSQPGAGLGLSLVAAVADAHQGRLELDEGPGKVGDLGPGLRVALVFPRPS